MLSPAPGFRLPLKLRWLIADTRGAVLSALGWAHCGGKVCSRLRLMFWPMSLWSLPLLI